ncbi:Ger(x)C family spore germination protein [Alkalihalobacillus sp. LMS39]|uniref:Ger(x)C family spore germination protein n=1 Tax=Alkalihalobacillus sp. LMS39 TaxID=2924032 RepID=UPI001FB318BA|nr:Ger(x)C family spore germination protein [Alkalihalobacillus sp. LMS39]UOE94492.1 Ger(x)C family spore germination protein [Alkalihalobacillus sp. LMS39]
MKTLIKLNIIFIFFFIMSACSPEIDKPVIEDLGMVGVLGFDYVDDEKMKVTVTFPQPQKDAEEKTQRYSAEVTLPHEAILEVSSMSEKVLSTSQLRVVLFSEEYAREVGLWRALHSLYRDPQIGTNVFVAVVKGTAEEFLMKEYKDKPEINVYLNEMLRPKAEETFNPYSTIHHFIFRAKDDVSDPTAPYLEIVDDTIKLTSVALFKDEKMVDTITPEEGKLVEAFKKRKRVPNIKVELTEEDGSTSTLLLMFVESRFNVKGNTDMANPKMFLHLYVRGMIEDYNGEHDLGVKSERKKVEKQVEEALEANVMKLVTKFQKHKTDSAGFGESFRIANAKEWDKEKWRDVFAQTEMTTHVEVTIVSTGSTK